jgi:fluoroquinolone transport system ATP-binding protein
MIEVENLSYTYPNQREKTIKDMTFSIHQGEIFAFLGPSGAGKSTLQKILIGLLKGYEGKASVLGKEVKYTDANYYEEIGVAFEFPNFYHRLTALENLQFFRKLYTKQTADPMELLKLVGLADAANVRFSHFSKGMKMRLNFCRALLNHPKILFLDEPTSGLDPVNAKNMKNLILQKKNEGTTIVITTHNMAIAEEICDRVAFVVDGEIRLIDSPKKLKVERGKKVVSVEYEEPSGLQKSEFSLESLGENHDFLLLIKQKKIVTIHTQEASLEDIFIQVTGRRLDEDETRDRLPR